MGHDNRVHYHIRWTGKATDWERIANREEADESARQLALPGESFAVEEHGESCPQCLNLMKKIHGRDSSNEASA